MIRLRHCNLHVAVSQMRSNFVMLLDAQEASLQKLAGENAPVSEIDERDLS
jgi:hypothetical protein